MKITSGPLTFRRAHVQTGVDVQLESDGLVIRRMVDSVDDYDLLVRWRNQPHVRKWWDPDDSPLTREGAIEQYRSDTLPESPSTACIVELQGEPIGFMQFYRWSSYAEDADLVGIPWDEDTWGIDQFIGEPDEVGRGLGTRMVCLLCEYLESRFEASAIVLTTELGNRTAIRCYEKSGFGKVREVLDTDTRDGERVRSWLMVRS